MARRVRRQHRLSANDLLAVGGFDEDYDGSYGGQDVDVLTGVARSRHDGRSCGMSHGLDRALSM